MKNKQCALLVYFALTVSILYLFQASVEMESKDQKVEEQQKKEVKEVEEKESKDNKSDNESGEESENEATDKKGSIIYNI